MIIAHFIKQSNWIMELGLKKAFIVAKDLFCINVWYKQKQWKGSCFYERTIISDMKRYIGWKFEALLKQWHKVLCIVNIIREENIQTRDALEICVLIFHYFMWNFLLLISSKYNQEQEMVFSTCKLWLLCTKSKTLSNT